MDHKGTNDSSFDSHHNQEHFNNSFLKPPTNTDSLVGGGSGIIKSPT
jgi:hypothetical protein